MLTFRAADMKDVHQVFADLSDISAQEVVKECGNWWNALPKVQQLLGIEGACTEALVDDRGKAVAIFGHYPSNSPKMRTTWFVFSQGFMLRGIATTLACRRRVSSLRFFYPNVNFHSYTASDHWTRGRWFSLLGFEYVGRSTDGQYHYILLESGKVSDEATVGRYNPTNPRAS